MRSSKVWVVIFFLGLLATIVTILPGLKFGSKAVFYTIDPDVQYLSNSFAYIEKGKIQYDVHPGTPTIILHAWTMLPLRVYAKLVAKTPFITWVLFNAEVPYYYVRIFQSLWLGLGMGILLGAVYVLTQSMLLLLFSWLAMFVYTVFPYFGSSIVPETTSFFLTAVWLLIFAKSYRSISNRMCLWLSVVTGLAVANKFSNLTLVPITILLVWFIPKIKVKKRVMYSFFSILVTGVTFIVATWPIRRSYPNMWRWVAVLASTTGTHGGGDKAIFSLTAFLGSANNLIGREWWPTLILGVLVGLVGLNIFRTKIKPMGLSATLAYIVIVSTIVFAKFPLSHYQLANYTLIVFILTGLLNYVPRLAVVIFVGILIPAVSTNLFNYQLNSSRAMIKAERLENYLEAHPSAKGTLWEWARVKDFSFLWGRDWAHAVFDKELTRYRPDLLAITSDMRQIKINNRELRDVFGVCWDRFYVQNVTAPAFLSKYLGMDLQYTELPEIEEIGLIESNHCKDD